MACFKRELPANHFVFALLAKVQAFAQLGLGDVVAAEQSMLRYRDGYLRAEGEASIWTVLAQAELALVDAALGRTDAAVERLEKYLPRIRMDLLPTHVYRMRLEALATKLAQPKDRSL